MIPGVSDRDERTGTVDGQSCRSLETRILSWAVYKASAPGTTANPVDNPSAVRVQIGIEERVVVRISNDEVTPEERQPLRAIELRGAELLLIVEHDSREGRRSERIRDDS
ncbi:MAG: hypothetical protein WBQ66_08025, partial [Blastocatellia bacterium]